MEERDVWDNTWNRYTKQTKQPIEKSAYMLFYQRSTPIDPENPASPPKEKESPNDSLVENTVILKVILSVLN